MKIKVWVSVGLAGCTKSEIIEMNKEDWDNMSEKDREDLMHDTVHDMMDWGYEELL